MGPVDIVIIDFPGNHFTGRIAPSILDLVERGIVRILDLLFVMKDADGTVTSLRLQDFDAELRPAFVGIDLAAPGSLDHDDVDELADDLRPNSSTLVIAFENSWAAQFTDAVRAADGVVVDQIRIPAAVAETVLATV